jgi:hypothetical protein
MERRTIKITDPEGLPLIVLDADVTSMAPSLRTVHDHADSMATGTPLGVPYGTLPGFTGLGDLAVGTGRLDEGPPRFAIAREIEQRVQVPAASPAPARRAGFSAVCDNSLSAPCYVTVQEWIKAALPQGVSPQAAADAIKPLLASNDLPLRSWAIATRIQADTSDVVNCAAGMRDAYLAIFGNTSHRALGLVALAAAPIVLSWVRQGLNASAFDLQTRLMKAYDGGFAVMSLVGSVVKGMNSPAARGVSSALRISPEDFERVLQLSAYAGTGKNAAFTVCIALARSGQFTSNYPAATSITAAKDLLVGGIANALTQYA